MVQYFRDRRLRKKIKIDFARSSSYSTLNRGPFSGLETYLDRTISLRTIVKYSLLILIFLVILGSVFILGRISADKEKAASANTTDIPVETKIVKTEEIASKNTSTENKSEPIKEVPVKEEPVEEEKVAPPVVKAELNVTPKPAVPSCENKIAEFDYNYTKMNITVSDFVKELKGENWATIVSLKLTVTNTERCLIVNPTQIKIKLNPKGKGSVWWDDEVFLPDTFKHMLPGTTVSDVVPVHVSYSDIYGEKDMKVVLFDDYDITMASYRKILTIK